MIIPQVQKGKDKTLDEFGHIEIVETAKKDPNDPNKWSLTVVDSNGNPNKPEYNHRINTRTLTYDSNNNLLYDPHVAGTQKVGGFIYEPIKK